LRSCRLSLQIAMNTRSATAKPSITEDKTPIQLFLSKGGISLCKGVFTGRERKGGVAITPANHAEEAASPAGGSTAALASNPGLELSGREGVQHPRLARPAAAGGLYA